MTHRLPALTGMLLLALANPSWAQELSLEQRKQFNMLTLQRNKLHARLEQLDTRAADLIKDGHDPVGVHAEQVAVQDELDLLQLRLELLATRFGLEVPPVPGQDDQALEGSSVEKDLGPAGRKITRAFSRGRERALAKIRRDCEKFLASLDFSEFLAVPEPDQGER